MAAVAPDSLMPSLSGVPQAQSRCILAAVPIVPRMSTGLHTCGWAELGLLELAYCGSTAVARPRAHAGGGGRSRVLFIASCWLLSE